jgi:hypothetical protein
MALLVYKYVRSSSDLALAYNPDILWVVKGPFVAERQ